MGGEKVSLIVPIYNAENVIRNTINCILKQSIGFENIEVIFVNDNSNDNSCDIIGEYMKKYDNIKLISLKNNSGSPGKPRNVGIQNATTDYIMFLDQDDEYYPEGIQALYEAIEEDKSDFVMASYINCYNDGKYLDYMRLLKEEKKVILDPKCQESSDLMLNFFAPWSKIYNRQFVIDNNAEFLEYALHEDVNFFIGCVVNANQVTVLPNNFTYHYNIRMDSTVHNYSLKSFRLFLKGVKTFDEFVKDLDLCYSDVMSYLMESLVLVFTNLNKADKNVAINELIELENNLNTDFDLYRNEVRYLNNLIMDNKAKSAIKLSEIYKRLYNNFIIKIFYKKASNFLYKLKKKIKN